MDFKRVDVGNATEAVRLLLEELALEEYRFTIGLREPVSEVRVEYAASDGWRNATLTVPDAALLKSRQDSKLRSGLATEWRHRLTRAKRRTSTREDRRAEATALGRAWADEKANALRNDVLAADWPDFWDDASNGPLPPELTREERSEMLVSATRAAQERWRELRSEQLHVESIEEDDGESEAGAVRLEASLGEGLPRGIRVGRDGPRVHLHNAATDQERSVTSLADAARVIEEWTEQSDD
jgi:hypothetical protein